MSRNTGTKLTACISSVIHREQGFQDYRFIAKRVLESLGLMAERNYEDVLTQKNFDAVLSEECDLFVLLLGNEMSKAVEGELRIALSRGLPILVFIRQKRDKRGNVVDPDAATKLLKAGSPELYERDRVYFETGQELAEKLEYQTREFLTRKLLLAPIIGADPPIAYTEGIRLLSQAKYRIVLVQKTSCFWLGPRVAKESERLFYNALMDWVSADKKRVFIHCFSWPHTQKAMHSGEYDLIRARRRACSLIAKGGLQRTSLIIRKADKMDIVSHLVADTGLGLNFWIGERRYYLFLPCFLAKESALDQIIAADQATGNAFASGDIRSLYAGNPF